MANIGAGVSELVLGLPKVDSVLKEYLAQSATSAPGKQRWLGMVLPIYPVVCHVGIQRCSFQYFPQLLIKRLQDVFVLYVALGCIFMGVHVYVMCAPSCTRVCITPLFLSTCAHVLACTRNSAHT